MTQLNVLRMFAANEKTYSDFRSKSSFWSPKHKIRHEYKISIGQSAFFQALSGLRMRLLNTIFENKKQKINSFTYTCT